MKAMISQPMNGKSDKEIRETREAAVKILEELGFEIVDSYFTEDFEKRDDLKAYGVENPHVLFMAKSLDRMSMCNAVYFCLGWEKARECRIEYEVAKAYGLEIIREEE